MYEKNVCKYVYMKKCMYVCIYKKCKYVFMYVYMYKKCMYVC